jgi:uncharacterized protein (DUF1697 family)
MTVHRAKPYVVLLRGVNVGGKNKLSMAALKKSLEDLGYKDVVTVIASGNVILQSHKTARAIQKEMEAMLPNTFKLDSELIKVLVLSKTQLVSVIKNKPKGFGDEPKKYHSDAIFLMDISSADAMKVFSPKEGVDKVWKGKGVIYSQRLSSKRTQSRLGRIIGTPAYKSMTIRSWNTTTKLLALLNT